MENQPTATSTNTSIKDKIVLNIDLLYQKNQLIHTEPIVENGVYKGMFAVVIKPINGIRLDTGHIEVESLEVTIYSESDVGDFYAFADDPYMSYENDMYDYVLHCPIKKGEVDEEKRTIDTIGKRFWSKTKCDAKIIKQDEVNMKSGDQICKFTWV